MISLIPHFIALTTLVCISTITPADGIDDNIIETLSQKSAIPQEELRTLLASCKTDSATQLAFNFCAWRDQLIAENKLAKYCYCKTETSELR